MFYDSVGIEENCLAVIEYAVNSVYIIIAIGIVISVIAIAIAIAIRHRNRNRNRPVSPSLASPCPAPPRLAHVSHTCDQVALTSLKALKWYAGLGSRPSGSRVLVKGRTYQEYVLTESTEDAEVHREFLRTSVVALDLATGEFEEVQA